MKESEKIYKQEFVGITKDGKYINCLVCQNDNGQDRKEKTERYKDFK